MTDNLPAPVQTQAPFTAKLAEALAAASRACRAVPHDKRNEFQKYNYTSSEAIIAEAREALAAAGLSLIPLETTLNGWDRQGENRFELERKFLLQHASGERYPIVIRWPVCPEKGRPLDKAVAIADTTSLAYYLRDLLLMPRCDPTDDVAARDDTPRQQPAPQKEPRPGATRENRIRTAARKHHREWRLPQLLALFAGQHQSIDKLDDVQEKVILDRLAAPARYKDEPPADGPLLLVLIEEVEATLLHDGLCAAGDLLAALRHAMDPTPAARLPAWKDWLPAHVSWGWQQVKDFARARRAAKAAPPVTAA